MSDRENTLREILGAVRAHENGLYAARADLRRVGCGALADELPLHDLWNWRRKLEALLAPQEPTPEAKAREHALGAYARTFLDHLADSRECRERTTQELRLIGLQTGAAPNGLSGLRVCPRCDRPTRREDLVIVRWDGGAREAACPECALELQQEGAEVAP